jgi:hypothetical protein
VSADVVHLDDRRPARRRLAVDNAAAVVLIRAAFAGAARARVELVACPCRTMPYLDHRAPDLHERNSHP